MFKLSKGKNCHRQSVRPNWGWILLATLALAALSCNAIMGAGKPATQPVATQTKTSGSAPTTAKPPTNTPMKNPTMTKAPTATKENVPASGATQVAPQDGMLQVYIPAGEFLMGATDAQAQEHFQKHKMPLLGATPQHKVYLDAYWIDKTDVTNAMFRKFVDATDYKTDAEKEGSGMANASSGEFVIVKGVNWQHPQGKSSNLNSLENHPVVQMSWNDAKAYCEWAGRRLPTEAEWEKAARGTDARKYPWGNDEPACDRANYWGKAKGGCVGLTSTTVDQYPSGASPYGVLDMAGNVYEWVADWYDINYYASSPGSNPTGPNAPSLAGAHVLRGGSWASLPDSITVYNRLSGGSKYGSVVQGFRCANRP